MPSTISIDDSTVAVGGGRVAPQVTDAVTQANVKVLGDAPAMAMGLVYQTMAQSTGLAFQNAVAAQQQMNATAQAATVQGINQLYSFDTISTGVADSEVANANLPEIMSSLLAVVQAFQKSGT